MNKQNAAGTRNMPRKRKRVTTDQAGRRQQFNVSFDPAYAARLEAVADALGVDVVALIRMIVRENLAPYEERAQRVRDSESKGGK